jgi:hypothetical protein
MSFFNPFCRQILYFGKKSTGNIYLELPTPQHIPLYPDIPQMKRSVLRGKRFVEKVLDTGKKVDPLRCANPQKKRNRYTPEITFLPESAGFEFLSRFVIAGTG